MARRLRPSGSGPFARLANRHLTPAPDTRVYNWPAASGQRPAASGQRPAASGQRPAASGQRPAASGQRPAASGQRPAASGQRPAASGQRPAASGQRPAASGQRPAARTASPGDRLTRLGSPRRPDPRTGRARRFSLLPLSSRCCWARSACSPPCRLRHRLPGPRQVAQCADDPGGNNVPPDPAGAQLLGHPKRRWIRGSNQCCSNYRD